MPVACRQTCAPTAASPPGLPLSLSSSLALSCKWQSVSHIRSQKASCASAAGYSGHPQATAGHRQLEMHLGPSLMTLPELTLITNLHAHIASSCSCSCSCNRCTARLLPVLVLLLQPDGATGWDRVAYSVATPTHDLSGSLTRTVCPQPHCILSHKLKPDQLHFC